MKFFKALLVGLLLLVAGLLLIGVFVPEIDDSFDVRVNEPIITVYAGLMDTEFFPEWIDNLESVEHTSGFLALPGSTVQLHFKSSETRMTYTMEVVDAVPMQSVRVRIHNEMMEVEMNIKCKADGLSTDLNVFVQIKGKGMIARAAIPLMKTVIMDQIKNDFNNLKLYLEENQ